MTSAPTDRMPAGGIGTWLGAAAAGGLVFVAGLAFTATNPAIVGILLFLSIFGVAFAYLVLSRPTLALCILFVTQIMLPIYIRFPIVPGLPAMPPALVLLVLLIMLVMVAQMLDGSNRAPKLGGNILTTSILVYGGVLVVSMLLNGASGQTITLLTTTYAIPAAVYFVALRLLPTTREVEKVFLAVHVTAICCGLLALHEFFAGYNIVAKYLGPSTTIEEDFVVWYLTSGRTATGDETLYRVFSFFTNPLELGVFMVLVYPFALLRFVAPQPFRKKLINGAALVIILAGLFVSFSRGPMLGLIMVTIYLAFPVRQVRYWIAAGSAAIATALMFAWPWIGAQIMERVQGSENVTIRLKLWQNALKIVADNPLIGIGYGNYYIRHVETLRANQIGPFYEFSWERVEKIGTIESIFLSLAAETGIIGLGAYLAIVAAQFILGSKVLMSGPTRAEHTIVLSCLASVFGFLVCGITVAHNIQYTPAVLYFGLMMSSVATIWREHHQTRMRGGHAV